MTEEIHKVQIKRQDRLLRSVQFLNPNFIKPDGTPTSASFSLKKDEDGLSVDIQRLTTFKKAIFNKSRFRLFAIDASFVFDFGLQARHDPLPENRAHGSYKAPLPDQ